MKTINPFPTNGVQRAQKEKGIPLVSCCFFHPLIQQDSNNSLSNNTGSWAINHPAIQAFKLVGFNLALTNPVPAEWLEFFSPFPPGALLRGNSPQLRLGQHLGMQVGSVHGMPQQRPLSKFRKNKKNPQFQTQRRRGEERSSLLRT